MSAILLLFCLFRRRNKWKNSYNVRESKTLLDSGFHAVDSGFYLLDSRSFSVELGFRIRIVSGFRIPTPVFRIPKPRIPDSTSKNFQDSGFQMQKFPWFWNPDSFTWSEKTRTMYYRYDVSKFCCNSQLRQNWGLRVRIRIVRNKLNSGSWLILSSKKCEPFRYFTINWENAHIICDETDDPVE